MSSPSVYIYTEEQLKDDEASPLVIGHLQQLPLIKTTAPHLSAQHGSPRFQRSRQEGREADEEGGKARRQAGQEGFQGIRKDGEGGTQG